MPILTRKGAPKLLTRVKNKTHATAADHHHDNHDRHGSAASAVPAPSAAVAPVASPRLLTPPVSQSSTGRKRKLRSDDVSASASAPASVSAPVKRDSNEANAASLGRMASSARLNGDSSSKATLKRRPRLQQPGNAKNADGASLGQESTSNRRPRLKRPRHTSEAEEALPGRTVSPARLGGDVRSQPRPEFKRPGDHSVEDGEGEKENGAEAEADSDSSGIFGGIYDRPRHQKAFNIHASKTQRGYGAAKKRANAAKVRRDQDCEITNQEEKEAKDRERPRFALPSSSMETSTTTSRASSARFQMPGGALTTSRSSSLSSLHLSPLADRHTPDATTRQPSPEAPPPPECPLCGQPVAPGEHEMFADEARLPRGRRLDYRWQTRFCWWHRRRAAAARFVAEGYSAIDWEGLETRMCGHAAHLEAVLKGDVPSQHRARLTKRQRRRPRAGVTSVVDRARGGDDDDDDDDDGVVEMVSSGRCVAGYYGPRGERLIADHILTHFSGPIRAQASRDRLVAAPGVSGGVSAFVQDVLVPELAERLVAEDLGVSHERARSVLQETVELGEALHPEET